MTEETIFLAALEQATPAARAAYLDVACAGDPALRERVEALLRSHADPDSFLDRPALALQAEEGAEPDRTTEPPAGASLGDVDEPAPAEEPLAFLAPGEEPGSLGRLDHYEVLEEIGRGGMGVVFKARDTRLQRVVAVKVLAARLAASGTARQRFFREARAAAAVRDEHVVSIHEVSEEDGPTPYLVMEFIVGVTLEKRVKARGPLAVKEVLRIGMQAAEGLASAHRQGLIHRDVKPANILLENGVERVKITDFGLARAADDASLSQSGVVAGTPLYMSPEQARGEALDARSDLFSLGSVLYTLCTGRAAFSAGSTMAVLRRVREEAPRPIREVNPDIPEWLAAVVGRLLAKDATERFQTAGELAELLGQRLAQLQTSGPAPPPPEVSEGVSTARPKAQPWWQSATRRKRFRMAAGVVLAVIISGLATVAVLWHGRNRADSPGLTGPGLPSEQADVRPGDAAPDLSAVMPLIHEDFGDPDKCQFPTIQNKEHGGDLRLENGRYIVGKASWADGCSVSCQWAYGDFACQVVGCAVAGEGGWALGLRTPDWDRALAVCMRRDGTVQVGDCSGGRDWKLSEAMNEPIQHSAIQPGDQSNTLLLILRDGRRLEIYVNGTAISSPIQLERPLAPWVIPTLVTWSREVEFTQYTMWLLPPTPPPARGDGDRAPDLTGVKPEVDDTFSDPDKSVFRPSGDRYYEASFAEGRLVLRHLPIPEEDLGYWCRHFLVPGMREEAFKGDVACQVVGRVLSDRDLSWEVVLITQQTDRDVGVRLRRDGTVEVGYFLQGPRTIVGPIRHPAIRPGDEDNTVLVILRGGRTLEIYVNGAAVAK
jgi:serine/threonine protein kinase